jgi:RHS repeat-associated protein
VKFAAANNLVTVTDSGANRTLTYDANGNLTNDGNGKVYAYDAANRMISVTQGGTTTGYVYDGWGERVQETSNGAVVKQWVWCGGARPCEERDASNNVTKRFYVHGEQIAGANYYFTFDHLGSVREMTNSAGGLVARYDYDPYGRRTLVSGTDLADFGFTGFYYDQASGLDLTRTRAYDGNLGRWLSRDTIGEEGGINLYTYCINNPINLIDTYGESFASWLGAAGAGVGFILSLPVDALEDISTGGVGALANPATTAAATGIGAGAGYIVGNAIDNLINNMSGSPSGGTQRTPEENKKARCKYKNNKPAARQAYTDKTGNEWPVDENGQPWPGEHTPSLKAGGDPMEVTPRDPGAPDPHNIPGPDGQTDYQRWGAQGTPARIANQANK